MNLKKFAHNIILLILNLKYNTSYFKLENVGQVNNYVSDHTNGKITNIIDSIDNILFMIINALYFNGSWDKKFYESSTTKRAFKNSDGTVLVDTMYQKYEDGLYYEDEKVKCFPCLIDLVIYHIK